MRLPFYNAGASLERLSPRRWDITLEDHDEPRMRQCSVWFDLGRFSLMLFIRWENYS